MELFIQMILSICVVYAMARCLCVCVSCHKPIFCRNSWTDWAGIGILAQLCYKGIWCLLINKETSCGWSFVLKSELSRFFWFSLQWHDDRYIVVNLVRLTTIASLSHWATFVYCTMGRGTQCHAVCLLQLRLVSCGSMCRTYRYDCSIWCNASDLCCCIFMFVLVTSVV